MAYVVIPGGPMGFQVNAAGPDYDTRLIGDFSTRAEAEAFAASMRQIDAGRSYSLGPKQYPSDGQA
jgi:hypothetical protein